MALTANLVYESATIHGVSPILKYPVPMLNVIELTIHYSQSKWELTIEVLFLIVELVNESMTLIWNRSPFDIGLIFRYTDEEGYQANLIPFDQWAWIGTTCKNRAKEGINTKVIGAHD